MFSIGLRFNVDSLHLIPKNSLFCETDESEITILKVYQQIANALQIDLKSLSTLIAENVYRVFPTLQSIE